MTNSKPKSTAAGSPFTADVSHDDVTESVALSIDGIPVETKPVTRGAAGTVSFPFSDGMPAGSYTFTAVCANVDGASPVSDPAMLVLGGSVPAKPSTITFRFE